MKKLIIISSGILLFTTTAMGQIVDKTEDKAKQKTNQRVDRKIDNGIDKGLDAIEGLFGKKKKKKKADRGDDARTESEEESREAKESQEKANSMMANMFGGGDVDVEDEYHFDHNFVMQTDTYDKKGKLEQTMDTKLYTSDDTPHMGMEVLVEGQKSRMIYDLSSYQMVTLVNSGGQKMGMAMKLEPETFEEYSKDEDGAGVNDYSSAKFTKTGRTETISGYTCHEYKMENNEQDDDYEYYYWVAPDADMDVMKSMATMMTSNKKMSKNYKMPENYPDGSMMRMVTDKKKNDEKTVVTIKEANRNQPETFSTVGYRMMSMGGGQ